ncbi:MAG: hypothetical protein UR89_C0008G0013 [Candidatus Roizmanbacteria bacterium GW2011_GWA2_35_8]|uniref:Uncharacterized protein n=1 Tax=Candidatus Roizmanbacteria bacterium GW2011_GWA2_35_8 TaxID=1618479 RepID=A0A0G0DEA5_9BACT|nr:MAG: hypothetical protein UR89_C0008G0013 [Candidatus Roizmanbacteria bacterium GW2011_GWA2_35_8]
MLKDKLSKIITLKPDIMQFAKDRKYEESWILPIENLKPTDEIIDNYLSKEKFETLIVEYIWNSKDDNNRFVLTLFLDKKCQLQNPKEFVEICLNLFYNYQNFYNFIDTIDLQIIGKNYLLLNPVDSINIGVFNHWLSVRPVELWSRGEEYNFDNVKSKIHAWPEIEKTNLNYQGLLFRFNVNGNVNGPYYGIKTPCCNKQESFWIVNYEKVDYWIKLMTQD